MEGREKTLYLECSSGISGDMTVGALLDLGANQDKLKNVLDSLPVTGFQVNISRVKKAGLDVCDFDVILDSEHENHDHDMTYLHGTDNSAVHAGEHAHEHHSEQQNGAHVHYTCHAQHDSGEHNHVSEHHSHGHHHAHEHRGMTEVVSIINQADMTARARQTAIDIFNILAKAEAKAHGVPTDQVHFHEVGAVDSIVDIISIAVCLDDLDITRCIVPSLTEGQGTVRCQHGILPIPVPAVANIVSQNKLNLSVCNIQGELVTPTGAAVVAAIKTDDKLPEHFTMEKIGMGAGKRQYERPSILRAMLIEVNDNPDMLDASNIEPADSRRGYIYKLESNIDDCTGEALGYVMEQLLMAGARDVYYMPVYMKKNRPAYILNVLCTKSDIEKMEQIIFAETTTIGIRRAKMERTTLSRRVETVKTTLGEAKVKVCEVGDTIRKYPEYDSVVELCKVHHMPFQEVFALVSREAVQVDM